MVDSASRQLIAAALFASLVVAHQASDRYQHYSGKFVKAVFRAFVEIYPERENEDGRRIAFE